MDKDSLFSGAQMTSIIKNYWEPIFFPQRPNFSAELAEKFCQELATLSFTVFTLHMLRSHKIFNGYGGISKVIKCRK